MSSSATDARTVIAVEKLLAAGAILLSEQVGDVIHFKISMPASVMNVGTFNVTDLSASVSGYGATFPEAFNDAYWQLPPAAVAA